MRADAAQTLSHERSDIAGAESFYSLVKMLMGIGPTPRVRGSHAAQ
jgi:hypothetical protein